MDSEKKAKLYERALEDYLDVSVYAAYLQHVLKTVKDHDRVREIYDKALRRCALHFTKNALIWATVIDFEQRVLDRMSESDEVDDDEETKQESRIRKLYMRWIGVPGVKLDLAMQLYEEFENENAESDEDAARSIDEARKIVERTKKAVEPRLKFEKRISDATDKDELFIAYVVSIPIESLTGNEFKHTLDTNTGTQRT